MDFKVTCHLDLRGEFSVHTAVELDKTEEVTVRTVVEPEKKSRKIPV